MKPTLSFGIFEGLDVGIYRRGPVLWDLYERHGAFPYSGTIERVHYEPGAFAPDSEEVRIAELREIGPGLE